MPRHDIAIFFTTIRKSGTIGARASARYQPSWDRIRVIILLVVAIIGRERGMYYP